MNTVNIDRNSWYQIKKPGPLDEDSKELRFSIYFEIDVGANDKSYKVQGSSIFIQTNSMKGKSNKKKVKKGQVTHC